MTVRSVETPPRAATRVLKGIGRRAGARTGRRTIQSYGLAGLAALALAPAAHAGTTVSRTTPVAQETINPCTGEPVTLTGTAHQTISYSDTAALSGIKFHSVIVTKLSLSGTALPSGARYQNEQQQTEEMNGTFKFELGGGLAPYEATSKMTMLLIRQGDAPREDDFFTRLVSHITYTANGVPTVQRTTLDVFCR